MLVGCGILGPRISEAAKPQLARVAPTAGSAICIRVVAASCQGVVHPQSKTGLDDPPLVNCRRGILTDGPVDEIGELPPAQQTKLLRIIEYGEFERLGSSRTIKADVRIIAATNRDLEAEVRAGRFREDLWYRLKALWEEP